MEIKQATEWNEVRDKLLNQIYDLPVYNPDFFKMLHNIDHMVTQLSRLGVEHKRNPEHWALVEQLEKINNTINLVEKYILLTTLSF